MAKKNYDENVDYQALIDQSVERGDYQAAAEYERKRNEKIADMDALGTNHYGAKATDNFSKYLKSESNAAGNGAVSNFVASADAWDGAGWDKSMPTFDNAPWEASRPSYTGSYAAQIDEMLDKLLNRESFSYNAESDPIFQQYRSQYEREGARAMNDTLSSAAMSAGGMNSSAVTAAQQAQNRYGAALGEKVPELYQLAYSMYLDDIDAQVRDLKQLQAMEESQYSRYLDELAAWENARDFAYDAYRDRMSDWRDERDFSYDKYRDDMDAAAKNKKTSGSGSSSGGSYSSGTGGTNWDAMYWEAMQSGSPASWLKQKANYGKYGLTSAPNFSDYENWYERSNLGRGEESRNAYGTYYDAVATMARSMAGKDASAITAYLQDMRAKQHISPDGIQRVLSEMYGEKRISAEKLAQLRSALGL